MKPSISLSLSRLFSAPLYQFVERRRTVLVGGIVLAIWVALAFRLYSLVERYAVNLLFSDQFDFFTPMFEGEEHWLALFRWQHGMHRQGVAMILQRYTWELTGWNTRTDAFVIWFFLCLVGAFALWLKRRLAGRWELWDVCAPMIVFNWYQYATLIESPNLAAAAMPLFLILCYGLVLTVKHHLFRLAGMLVFNLLLVSTGYGMFMGIVTPVIFALEAWHSWRNKPGWREAARPLLGAALACAEGGWVLYGYFFTSAVDCFTLNLEMLLKIPLFASLMFASFFGLGMGVLPLSMAFGALALAPLIWTWAASVRRVMRADPFAQGSAVVIVALTSYTLLFVGSASLGRVCLGYVSALASRYVTLLIPGMLGVYLYLATPRQLQAGCRRSEQAQNGQKRLGVKDMSAIAWAALRLVCILALLLTVFTFTRVGPLGVIEAQYAGKMDWKACYLQYEDYDLCTAQTGFTIYTAKTPEILEKLAFLKAHGYNLYLDR